MVNMICLHEECQRKPVKDGNGYCHLHGGRVCSKCSYLHCSNFAQTHGGVCIQHGYKKKYAVRTDAPMLSGRVFASIINHGARHYCTVIDCGKALFQTGKCRHPFRCLLAASTIDMRHAAGLHATIMDITDLTA